MRRPQQQPHKLNRQSAVWVWLLLSVLLVMQQLGWQHRYAHGDGTRSLASSYALAADAPAAFGLPEHSDDACAVLDHLCLGDAHSVPVLAWPAAIALAAPLHVLAVGVLGTHSLPPQARGPPHRV